MAISIANTFDYVIGVFGKKNPEELEEALKAELINHDNAFLNSFLSYGIYTGRKYMLDFIHNSSSSMKYAYIYAGKSPLTVKIDDKADNNSNITPDYRDGSEKNLSLNVSFVQPTREQNDILKKELEERNSTSSEENDQKKHFMGKVGEARSFSLEKNKEFLKMATVVKVKTAYSVTNDLLVRKTKKPISPIMASEMNTPGSDKVIQDIISQKGLDLTLKQAYEMYMGDFIRKTFDLVDLPNLESHRYHSEAYGYRTQVKFENGLYEALNNLASAGVFRSKNPDGSFTLHVAFRGTDTQASSMTKYVHKAYADMSAYYDCFKPLEKAVLEYAKDPANNISQLHVSGHSLGGSMVQEFFSSPEVKKVQKQCEHLDIKGYTYGAPGSLKKLWYSFLPAAYHTLRNKKFKQLGMDIYSKLKTDVLDEINFVYETVATHDVRKIGSAMFRSIKNLGQCAVDHATMPLRAIISRSEDTNNPNIMQYKHRGDLIPKVGGLGYEQIGLGITLEDTVSEDKREIMMFEANTINMGTSFDNYGLAKPSKPDNFKKFKLIGKLGTIISQDNILLVGAEKVISKLHSVFVAKPLSLVKRVVALDYHDMLRYVQNLNHHIDKILEKNPQLKNANLTPRLEQFEIYNSRFTKAFSNSKLKDLPFKLTGEKTSLLDTVIIEAETSSKIDKNGVVVPAKKFKVRMQKDVLKQLEKTRIANAISRDITGEDCIDLANTKVHRITKG